MAHLASKIDTGNNAIAEKEKPSLMIVVRDFFLLEDISPAEQLESFLREDQNPEYDRQVELKNSIKRNLKNFFQSKDCFRLCRPVGDDELLTKLDELPYEKLSEKFKNKFKQLSSDISSKLEAKKINDLELNGIRLAEYLKLIVKAINNEEIIPVISITMRLRDIERINALKEELKR